MAVTGEESGPWLIDKSALARLPRSPVFRALGRGAALRRGSGIGRGDAGRVLLSDRGQHRAASIPDLLIAELAGLSVLHHDHDFDLVAAVTGPLVETLRVDA